MRRNIGACAILIGGLAVLQGCSWHGYQLAAESTAELEILQDELREGKTQIIVALDAAAKLVGQRSGDLTPAFEEFLYQLEELEGRIELVHGRQEEIQELSDTYLENWDQQLSDSSPAIRQRGQERRRDVERNFESLCQEYDRTRETFAPFLKGLTEIAKFLSHDLTPAGTNAVEDLVDERNRESDGVMAQIDDLIAELDRVAQTLSPKIPGANEQLDLGRVLEDEEMMLQ